MEHSLFELVGDDLNHLGTQIAERLSDSESLRQARLLLAPLKGIRARAILDRVRPPESITSVAFLSLCSDCLRRVSQAIFADGDVDARELDIAYTLVGPLAGYFAENLDRYSHFANLGFDQVGEFLDAFNQDPGPYGGAPESETALSGGLLATAVSALDRNSDAIDRYEHIIVTILTEIMRIGGLNPEERETIRSAREFVRMLRGLSDEYSARVDKPLFSSPRSSTAIGFPYDAQTETVTDGHSHPHNEPTPDDPAEALKEASQELDSLIGLPGVKGEVARLMSFLKVQQQRRKHGLRESEQTLHFVFTGNPGTGKTTVARIVAKILCGFGIVKTTRVVECDRAALVGGYLGQTAIKTSEVIESALDGVLFIDEAYALADALGQDMYGQEAINTLLKRMEDCRSRLVVIAAGYPVPMERFVRTNPGLESRFTRFIRFEDYRVSDLCRIFERFCSKSEYSLTPACRARLSLLFSLAYLQRDERFGNARFVRNVFEQVVSHHSQRVASLPFDRVDRRSLVTLDVADVTFEPHVTCGVNPHVLRDARWRGACPSCGKVSNGRIEFLGRRVNCKCGKAFVFPWWNLVPASVKGLPGDSIVPPDSHELCGESHASSTKQDIATESLDDKLQVAGSGNPASLLVEAMQCLKDGRFKAAAAKTEDAIALDWPGSDPKLQPYFICRATAYERNGNDRPMRSLKEYNDAAHAVSLGHYQQGIACYKRSFELDALFAWAPNNLAWLLATCRDRRFRDGSEAVRLATVACDLASWRCWAFLDTLAAGYAESGDFEKAVNYAEKAFSTAPANCKDEVYGNFLLFRAGKSLVAKS